MMNTVPLAGPSGLTIAVVGVGGIGSAFAFYLGRAGHAMTVVARPGSPRFRQLERDQAIVRTTGERVSVRVADALDEGVAYDLVIVTTLAHHMPAVLPCLQRSQARWIQFMFNTVEPERLREATGEMRCSFGMPFVMATLNAEGRLNATVSKGRKTMHGDRRWVTMFAEAGLPSTFEAEMGLWLRCHAPLCIAMEGIAFKAQQRGGGASWDEAMSGARGLHGGFAVMKGLGGRLYPRGKRAMNAAPNGVLAGMLWGLSRSKGFRELLATGVGECRALTDVLLAEAAKVGGLSPAVRRSIVEARPGG